MNRNSAFLRSIMTVACLMVSGAAMAQPADVITVGTVTGIGVVDVPVYIRDVAGTTLGVDQPAGSRIQSYSIRVTYAPASAVQSISFSRAGITSALTPAFESSPAVPGSISLLSNFAETTNLIPFTSNAPLPGNQVAHLTVTLAPGTSPGTTITLTLDPVLTQLTDQGGTATTVETTANGRLALVSGSIVVVSPATITATKRVSGTFVPGVNVTYVVVMQNSGTGAQLDNPGDEFVDRSRHRWRQAPSAQPRERALLLVRRCAGTVPFRRAEA